MKRTKSLVCLIFDYWFFCESNYYYFYFFFNNKSVNSILEFEKYLTNIRLYSLPLSNLKHSSYIIRARQIIRRQLSCIYLMVIFPWLLSVYSLQSNAYITLQHARLHIYISFDVFWFSSSYYIFIYLFFLFFRRLTDYFCFFLR